VPEKALFRAGASVRCASWSGRRGSPAQSPLSQPRFGSATSWQILLRAGSHNRRPGTRRQTPDEVARGLAIRTPLGGSSEDASTAPSRSEPECSNPLRAMTPLGDVLPICRCNTDRSLVGHQTSAGARIRSSIVRHRTHRRQTTADASYQCERNFQPLRRSV
jgi:hypothetical protein